MAGINFNPSWYLLHVVYNGRFSVSSRSLKAAPGCHTFGMYLRSRDVSGASSKSSSPILFRGLSPLNFMIPTLPPLSQGCLSKTNSDAARLTRCRHVRIYDRRFTGGAPGSTMTSIEGDSSPRELLHTNHSLPGRGSWCLCFTYSQLCKMQMQDTKAIVYALCCHPA